MKSKDVASTKTRKMDIFESVWLHGVHPNAESSSAVCIPPEIQAPRCASHCGVKVTKFLKKLCGVHPTAESDRGVRLRSVHHTHESKCTPQSQNWNLYESRGAFKGTIRRNPFRCEQFYNVRKDLSKNIFILTPRCDAHRGVKFFKIFKLCVRISRRNWNRIWIYLSLFIRGPDGF